jgi:hypothetical protein
VSLTREPLRTRLGFFLEVFKFFRQQAEPDEEAYSNTSPPALRPSPFTDLNALCVWMCYSNFLNRLDLNWAEADFASLL